MERDTRGRNVVLLVLDSLRRDRVSLYDDGVDFTDSIAALGAESLVFDNAVAQAPWTLPSHASMFTGTYPWSHGATQESPTFDAGGPTLVERFAAAGYRTGGFTPNPWVSPFSGLAAGFDTWDNFLTPRRLPIPEFVRSSRLLEWWSRNQFERVKKRLTDAADSLFETWSRRKETEVTHSERVFDRAESFVRETDADRPFFLYLNILDAHEPYYPPESYRERHAPGVDPHEECQIPSRHLKGETEANFDNVAGLYDAAVDNADDLVGSFVAFLREQQLLQNTVLVVVSDHGQALGEDGLYGHQYGVGPVLTHVPMLVRTPEANAERIDRLVELRELFDYLPSVAGVGPEYTPGVEIAKGGYGFPDLAVRQLPGGRDSEHYRRFRFALDREEYLVRTETPEQVTVTAEVRDSTAETDPSPTLLRALPTAETHDDDAVAVADPVEGRLEDLGYL
ncbi:MAG: sulfatase [Halobaculum sp.]